MSLDALDHAILAVLVDDARISFRELARRTGSTTPTVSARVKRLTDLGLIQGYRAAVAVGSLPGHVRLVRGMVGKRQAADFEAEMATWVAAHPGVLSWHVRGDGGVGVFVLVADLDAESDLLASLQGIGVKDASATTVTYHHGGALGAVFDGTQAEALQVPCAECRRPCGPDAIEERLGGKAYMFCCPSCTRLFRTRYERVAREA